MRDSSQQTGATDPAAVSGPDGTYDGHAGSPPVEVRRAAVSSFIGTTVEFYDFLLYGSAAALVFNKLFFSNLSPGWATAASFATFAAGYVVRVVGGLAFAHLGDRVGRKKALIATMLMMGIATGLMGALPTYAQVGALAPVLLIALRVVQGLAAGGEYGGAALMTAEHAPSKRRGLVGTATSLGLPTGGLLATAVFTTVSTMPEEAFLSWGWRIPFLIGFVLVGIGFWVRMQVTETPAFKAAQQNRQSDTARQVPAVALLRHSPATLVRGILLVMPNIAISSLFGSYLVSYAVGVGYTATQALLSVILGSAVALFTLPAYGALSDRLGRRPVFLIGSIGTAVLAYPCLALVDGGSVLGLLAAQTVIIGLISTAMTGPLVALLSEMFDTEVRYTGIAMTYQTATVIAGGFTPLLAAVLAASNEGSDSGPVALILVVLSVLGTVGVLLSRESRGRDLTRSSGAPDTAARSA